MEEDILDFLGKFKKYGTTEEAFTNGCCYWFSVILTERFKDKGAEIMYDEINNHFGTRIFNRVYDITGDVTEEYSWFRWNDLNDDLLKSIITRDCIMF